MVEGHLWKFIWQRTNKTDPWRAFISALADVIMNKLLILVVKMEI